MIELRNRKRAVEIVVSMIMAVVVFMQVAVAGQATPVNVTIDGCVITANNSIASTLKSASASTTASEYEAICSVSATFYAINTTTQETYTLGDGGGGHYYGGAMRGVTNQSTDIFYKAVSHHNVSYHGNYSVTLTSTIP